MITTDGTMLRLARSSDEKSPYIKIEFISMLGGSRDHAHILDCDSARMLADAIEELLDDDYMPKYRKKMQEEEDDQPASPELKAEVLGLIREMLSKCR